MDAVKLAVDIGNSAVKGMLISSTHEYIDAILSPSVMSLIDDKKYLTFTDDQDIYFEILESSLNAPKEIIAIGEKALSLPNYKEFDVMSTTYKANHPLTTALLFGNLLTTYRQHFTLPDTLTVTLTVSVPIVEAKTIGLQKEYTDLLTGYHKLRVYTQDTEQDILVHIKTCKVLNEGQAGFLGLLDTTDKTFHSIMQFVYSDLGEKGSPISSLEDFLIVDIGEGTTDLAVFRNKKFNPDYSYSVTKGFGNLLEDAMSKASREKLTIESRKELQQLLTSSNPRRKERRELWNTYVQPEKDRFIQLLVETILKTYGHRDYFDAIIFIGGGFTALTNYHVSIASVTMSDDTLFTTLKQALNDSHKQVDLLFGVPDPYARTINERGLLQVVVTLP